MNKLALLLGFLTLLGFVVFLGGELPYFIFYIFALSIVVPLIHSLITLIRLDGKVMVPKESFYRGDDVDITYLVYNRSPFLIPYIIIDSKVHSTLSRHESKLATSLAGGDSYRHNETINLSKRGFFDLGEIEVTISDIFRIFKFKKKISSQASLLVYPKIIELSSFTTSSSQHQGELVSRDGKFEDRSRINTLRDYVEGDNIKSIHWKLTAKKDEPIIKIFDNRVDSSIAVFLDNSLTSYSHDTDNRMEDKAVDLALSIIDYCLDNGLESTLIHQDKDRSLLTSGNESDQIKPFLDQLARLRATGKISFPDLILNNIGNFPKGSTIIMISPQLDKKLGARVLELLSRNYKPFLIIVSDLENKAGDIDQDIRGKLIKENIPVYLVNYHMNIKEVLEDYRD